RLPDLGGGAKSWARAAWLLRSRFGEARGRTEGLTATSDLPWRRMPDPLPNSPADLKGLANNSLKPTKAGRRSLERLDARGVASFARHLPARPATMGRLVRPLQLNEGTLARREHDCDEA